MCSRSICGVRDLVFEGHWLVPNTSHALPVCKAMNNTGKAVCSRSLQGYEQHRQGCLLWQSARL